MGLTPATATRGCPTATTGEMGLDETGAEGTPEDTGGEPGIRCGMTAGCAAAPGVPWFRVFLSSVIACASG
jgi:hypothetical protein